MKGIVFQEFMKYVGATFGESMIDAVVDRAELSHDGIYTSGGTYPFEEMVALISALHHLSGKETPEILREFGRSCFASWVPYSPKFFEGKSLFQILARTDEFHETEVRKLYPDAKLPSFVVEAETADTLVLGYHSPLCLTDLAIGVIEGAARHVEQPVHVSAERNDGPARNYARLTVTLG